MSDEKLLDNGLVDDWKPEEVEWRILFFLKSGKSFLISRVYPSEALAAEQIAKLEAHIARKNPRAKLLCQGSVIGQVSDYSHSIPIPRVKT